MNRKYLREPELLDFDRDGFLIVRNMYDLKEIEHLSLSIDIFASKTPEFGKQMLYFENSLKQKGQRILSRLEKFSDYDKDLRDFVYADKMIGRVSDLLGEPAVLFKEQVNFKMPGGDGFAPHQDIQPAWDDYAQYFISVLVTVDPSTLENGCLELAAGHHKRGWIGRKWKPLEGEELRGINFVPTPTLLSILTVPLCSSIMFWVMASPSPVPLSLVVNSGSKIFGIFSAEIPIPESLKDRKSTRLNSSH